MELPSTNDIPVALTFGIQNVGGRGRRQSPVCGVGATEFRVVETESVTNQTICNCPASCGSEASCDSIRDSGQWMAAEVKWLEFGLGLKA